MEKIKQPQVTEPGLKGHLELLRRDIVLPIPQDLHEYPAKTGDYSDKHQEDVDTKLTGPYQSKKYKPWITLKDREYTSDDPLINESAAIVGSPKSERETVLSILQCNHAFPVTAGDPSDPLINESEGTLGFSKSETEEIERYRPRTLWSCCCVREDFKFTIFRAKGLLLTILFYANLVMGWVLAIMWARIADRSNWLLPGIVMGSLIASNICCSRLLCLWDKWRDYFGWCWAASIITDILGFSMLKVLAVEWRTHRKMKFCQYLSFISSLSSYVIFVITTYFLAVSSSEDLIVFEQVPNPLVRFCWLISCFCLCAMGMKQGDEEDDTNWNRNYWHSVSVMLTTVFYLIGICTPFIYVCWWPNAGLYGIVFGTLLFICMIGWYLDVKYAIPTTIFFSTLCLLDLGFASILMYILIHEQCTCDIGLAVAGGFVAGWHLVFAYIYIGYFAVEMLISILRRCNVYIRRML